MDSFRTLCFLTIITMLVLSACGGDDSSNPVPTENSVGGRVIGNDVNVSVVSGSQIGGNTTPIDQLRKKISVSINNLPSDFELGSAYVARERVVDIEDGFDWIVEVRNVGDQVQCYINLDTVKYLSSDNTELGSDSLFFIRGRMREITDSNAYINSCLAPEESGYFIGAVSKLITFDQISQLEISTLSVSTEKNQALNLTMEVTSYQVTGGLNRETAIDFVVQNNGPVTGIIDEALVIMLDDNDEPLIWDNYRPSVSLLGEIASGQTGTWNWLSYYEGVSQRMIVILGFIPQPTTSSTPAPAPTPVPTPAPIQNVGNNTNISVIAGTQIGNNTAQINQLRKEVTFRLDTPHNDFEFGTAYVARSGINSSLYIWMVSVRNIGTQTYCYVKLNGGYFLSVDNTVIGNDSFGFTTVLGSLRKLTQSGLHINSCLESGQIGYFTSNVPATAQDQTNEIKFSTLTANGIESQPPELTMEVVGYSASLPEFLQTIEFSVVNMGPASAAFNSNSNVIAILLDDQDNLLMKFPLTYIPEIVLNSGQTGTQTLISLYEGVSYKVLVFVDTEVLPAL